MPHVVYALFKSSEDARTAITALENAGISESTCEIVQHGERVRESEIDFHEADSKRGLLRGIVAGAVAGGAMAALLAGPIDIIEMGAGAAAAMGAGLGGFYGALGGALSGAAVKDRHLDVLSRKLGHGEVLITAESDGLSNTERIEQLLNQHGAMEVVRGS